MIEAWFPTPVFVDLADSQIQKEIEEQYFGKEKEILKGIKKESWGDNIDATYSLNGDLLKEFQLNKLEGYINDCVRSFLNHLQSDVKQIKRLHSWVNYSSKYQYQNQHNHMPAKISGVYYIKSNEKDGNLRIHSPIRHLPQLVNDTNLSFNLVEYTPQAGKIVLFPSWVEHSVRPNMTDDTRISISFNYN